jgi:uncharacterized protein (DUF2147 family)
MRKVFVFAVAVCMLFAFPGLSLAADPSIVGVWSVPVLEGKNKGKERSHIEIFEKGGVYYGKIVKLSNRPANALCTKCKGDKKDKPLMGMLVLWNLKKEAGRYVDGRVLYEEDGKDYNCTFFLLSPDRMKVTANILLFFNESHYWTRVK